MKAKKQKKGLAVLSVRLKCSECPNGIPPKDSISTFTCSINRQVQLCNN